jgi:hypothetical protein
MAGCAAGERADRKRAAAEAAHAAPPQEDATQTVTDDPVGSTIGSVREPKAQAEEEEAPAAVARVQPPIDDNPGQVMGLASPAVDALLGRPRLRRIETPAEVWQYAEGACVMDLFLYPSDESAKDHRVTHYEIRGASPGAVNPRVCFRTIILGVNSKRAG